MSALPPALQALCSPESQLGLERESVLLAEHQPGWADLYLEVEHLIRGELLDAAISEETFSIAHVGSTSVPGLMAKPVLDIAVGMEPPINTEAVVPVFERAGFEFVADLGMYGGLFFTVHAAPDVSVAHLHVVDRQDFQWRWYLAFRDGLRNDPELRNSYQDLKQTVASQHTESRASYTQAKSDWVLDTVRSLDDNT